jgi:hypothetical protein
LGRALELAVKHDSNIDVVVAYRRKYLEQFSWTETIPRFIEYAKKVIHAHILLHYSKIIRSDYTINDSITRILLRYYSYIADGQTESYTISFVSLATGRHRLGRHWRKAHGRMMMMMTLAECRNNSTTKIYIPTWLTADATARWWSVACAKRIDKPRRLIFLTSHEYLHATIQTFVCVCVVSPTTQNPTFPAARAFNSSASFIWRHFTKEPDGLRAVASDPQTTIGEKTTLDKQIPSSRV